MRVPLPPPRLGRRHSETLDNASGFIADESLLDDGPDLRLTEGPSGPGRSGWCDDAKLDHCWYRIPESRHMSQGPAPDWREIQERGD
jgi:hypothetical protein